MTIFRCNYSLCQASANHEAIAEELSQALTTISEHVARCETELALFRTEEMQRDIADLYAHIFLFLRDTLAWFMKKSRRRLLDSMNEKFLHEFDAEIENIVSKSDHIKRKADQMSMAEHRVTRLTVEESRKDTKDLRLGLEGISRDIAETRYHAQQAMNRLEAQRRQERQEQANEALLRQRLIELLEDLAESKMKSSMYASFFLGIQR